MKKVMYHHVERKAQDGPWRFVRHVRSESLKSFLTFVHRTGQDLRVVSLRTGRVDCIWKHYESRPRWRGWTRIHEYRNPDWQAGNCNPNTAIPEQWRKFLRDDRHEPS